MPETEQTRRRVERSVDLFKVHLGIQGGRWKDLRRQLCTPEIRAETCIARMMPWYNSQWCEPVSPRSWDQAEMVARLIEAVRSGHCQVTTTTGRLRQ